MRVFAHLTSNASLRNVKRNVSTTYSLIRNVWYKNEKRSISLKSARVNMNQRTRSESIHAFGMTKIVWPSSSTTLFIPTTFGSIYVGVAFHAFLLFSYALSSLPTAYFGVSRPFQQDYMFRKKLWTSRRSCLFHFGIRGIAEVHRSRFLKSTIWWNKIEPACKVLRRLTCSFNIFRSVCFCRTCQRSDFSTCFSRAKLSLQIESS